MYSIEDAIATGLALLNISGTAKGKQYPGFIERLYNPLTWSIAAHYLHLMGNFFALQQLTTRPIGTPSHYRRAVYIIHPHSKRGLPCVVRENCVHTFRAMVSCYVVFVRLPHRCFRVRLYGVLNCLDRSLTIREHLTVATP